MFSRLTHRAYLLAQWWQSRAKRDKDPGFRTVRHIAFVDRYLPRPWPEPILCLGPRNDLELCYLRQAGVASVVGLDVFSQHPDILLGDMHEMKFPSASFGMVWASHVLEHARDPQRVFSEIARVLKPGGRLFVAYPTGFKTNWHDRWDYGDPDNLLNYLPAPCGIRKSGYLENQGSAEFYALFVIG